MSCPFLRPHHCGGCDDEWRCDGSTSPFVIKENLEFCFEGNHEECPNHILGLKQRELAKQIKLANQKKEKLVKDAMKHLGSILSQESDDESRLEKLKVLYQARLSDLHEYKAELRRLKGRT